MTASRIRLQYDRLSPGEMIERVRAFADAMASRRSVREFSSEPFPAEIVTEAIRAASSAPSGAHQQPWTFVVVTDRDVRARIRDAAEAEERKSWEGRMPEDWLAALEPLGLDWHKPHLTDAPVLIVVFAQPWGVVDTADGPQRVKHYYVDESVGIAVGLLLSALHLAGLATLTHTPSPMGFLREILDRPANERAFLVIPVGYPATDCTVPDLRRKSVETVMVRR
ncbi:MAG: nitroreductase family protein [Kofleriaceae bacterium]